MLNEMVICEELFHTPSGVAFADFITQGHRELGPFVANVSEPGCGAATTTKAGPRRALRPSGQRSICSKPARNLTVPSVRSISASPNMPDGSILILPMSIGPPLR